MIEVGIVAHHKRIDHANKLAEKVGAETISVDEQGISAEWNHRRLLEWMRDGSQEWSVILEDDAIPVDGFRDQLELALPWAPTPFVSLYLGRGRPPHWQVGISSVLANDVSWLVCSSLLHGVGYAVRTKLIDSVIRSLDRTWRDSPSLPIDEALTVWGLEMGIEFSYSRPSLVDHLDIEPVQRHDYGIPTETRKAWLFGSRESWDDSRVSLEYVPSW